jgi:hypothetical protein
MSASAASSASAAMRVPLAAISSEARLEQVVAAAIADWAVRTRSFAVCELLHTLISGSLLYLRSALHGDNEYPRSEAGRDRVAFSPQ